MRLSHKLFLYDFSGFKVNQARKIFDYLTLAEFKQIGQSCLNFLENKIKSGGP